MTSCIFPHIRFGYFAYRLYLRNIYTSVIFNRSVLPDFSVLWPLLTSHSSLLLRLMSPSVRSHGISPCSFLVYLSDLRTWVTVAFWASLPLASLPPKYALLSVSCSSGYDFAIASSSPHLTVWTLQVAFEFVGNYASVDFHHRTRACPSYQKNPFSKMLNGCPHSNLMFFMCVLSKIYIHMYYYPHGHYHTRVH